MRDRFPKILIIDETFHHKSGGGITLSNLFANWPKKMLFNACETFTFKNIDTDSCQEYYNFGNLENHFFLPFFIRKYIPHPILNNNSRSGLIKPDFINDINKSGTNKARDIISKFLLQLSFFIGVYPIYCKRKVSNEFLTWIGTINPDFIYTQLSDINTIRFIKELSERTKIPLCLHIMDDWVTTYSRPGLLYYYWNKRIDLEFRELIIRAEICLSISEGMSDEYKRRYSKEFIPFHNPINKDIWIKNTKSNFSIDRENIRILYSGRIGLGIMKSLSTAINVIEKLRKEGIKIVLELQVPPKNKNLFKKHVRSGAIIFNEFVDYDQIPIIFTKADILLLTYDFANSGLKFIKYSMPTKASEYMISGTPILLYCPKKVYLNRFFIKYKLGLVVSSPNTQLLKKALLIMIENEGLRKSYSNISVNYALTHFDSTIVRSEFLEVFENHRNSLIK